ncbi:MAG: flagellar basal body-associated FliL family protein [Bacillota bacterium]
MAPRYVNNDAEAAVKVKSGSGKKRFIIIIVAVTLVVLAGGATAAKFMLFQKKPVHKPPAQHAQKTATLELGSIVVNLADREESHYLRITVVLAFPGDEKFVEEINENKYRIRDQVIRLLRQKSYAEVAAPDYTERVKAELIREINRHLPTGREITDIYLSEFLLQ